MAVAPPWVGDGHPRAQYVCRRRRAARVPRLPASESRRMGAPSGWGDVAATPGYRALAGKRSTIVCAEFAKWVQCRVDRDRADAVRSASVWRLCSRRSHRSWWKRVEVGPTSRGNAEGRGEGLTRKVRSGRDHRSRFALGRSHGEAEGAREGRRARIGPNGAFGARGSCRISRAPVQGLQGRSVFSRGTKFEIVAHSDGSSTLGFTAWGLLSQPRKCRCNMDGPLTTAARSLRVTAA